MKCTKGGFIIELFITDQTRDRILALEWDPDMGFEAIASWALEELIEQHEQRAAALARFKAAGTRKYQDKEEQ